MRRGGEKAAKKNGDGSPKIANLEGDSRKEMRPLFSLSAGEEFCRSWSFSRSPVLV
jgi:hypothetical protein